MLKSKESEQSWNNLSSPSFVYWKSLATLTVCIDQLTAFYICLSSHVCICIQAANPGCILEDFVRWYSPLDWMEDPGSGEMNHEYQQEGGQAMAIRGYLSVRMQCEGT
jgi:hypothetical protein